MTEFGSSTDLETLRRSGRGKIVVLGVLVAGALGAATWAFLRKGGTGNPEEAGKVLVVTRGSTTGSSFALRDAGFETGEGTLQAWVDKAKEEVPDLDVDGVPAVMALADRFGWGYVVFESPADVDFSGLEFEGGAPEIPDDAQWAAVSAGDFAFPHVLTINPEPSKVLRDGSMSMLQALFEQEQLAALLEPESLGVDQLHLRDTLEEGRRKLALVPDAERLAEKVVNDIGKALTEGERVDPAPTQIGVTLESLTARPLADGSVLSVGRTLELVTRDAIRVDLDLGSMQQLLVGAPTAAASDRVPCAAFAGGAVEVGDWRDLTWSVDGSTALLSTLAGGETLWGLDDTKPGACAWTKLASVPHARPGLDGPAVPWRGGRLARVGFVDGLGVVSVSIAGEPELQLGMLESTSLSHLVWIDDDHLAALASYEVDNSSWIAVFSVRDPMRVVVVPASVAGGVHGMSDLAAVPGRSSLLVLGYGGLLVRVDLPAPPAALLAEPPLAPDQTPLEAEGRPTVYQLDPAGFSSKTLIADGNLGDLAVSRDGKHAVGTVHGTEVDPDAPGDGEIAVIDIEAGGMRLLTRNALSDREPHFTADGRHVVFSTRVEMPRSDWTITAARVVPR